MGFKRHTGTAWQEIGSAKRYDGSVWLRSGRAKRWDGSKWVEDWNSLAFRPWSGNNLGELGYIKTVTENGESYTAVNVNTRNMETGQTGYGALVTPLRRFPAGTWVFDWRDLYEDTNMWFYVYKNAEKDVPGESVFYTPETFSRRTTEIELPEGTYQLMVRIQINKSVSASYVNELRIYSAKFGGKAVPIIL